MHRGFTKRWRKRWDAGYHQDHLLWVIMDYAIDHARGTAGKVYLKEFNLTINVERGDFVFSYRGLAKTLKASVKQIRSRCGFIESTGFWARKRAHPCMVVSLCKYNLYNPLNDKQGHSKGHTEGTPWAQYNECKKNDKERARAKDHLPLVKNGEFVNE